MILRPSDVLLTKPPLTGTLGKSEVEYAAAVIVWALAQTGDEWRTLSEKELGKGFV